MNRRHLLQLSLSALAIPALAKGDRWAEGASLPALSDFGLEGKLPALKGKVVLLDFWASWCAPCKASFPTLNDLQAKYGSRGLVILGVNVDEDAADKDKFLKTTPASFVIVRDAAQKLVAAANVKTMPTSFVIDRAGVIRHVHSGFRSKDAAAFDQQISALL